jgi:hypothetical protein
MKAAVLITVALVATARAQHGVIREYAALAPTPDAVPLTALFDAPLSETSIARGPDGAFYLTGSPWTNGAPSLSSQFEIWRSADLKSWARLRTVDAGPKRYLSPEIHYLKDGFWLALGREGGGTELLKFAGGDLKDAAFARAEITSYGLDPSLFGDDDGTLYWVMGRGRVARLKADPMQGLAAEPSDVPLRIAGPPAQAKEMSVEHLRGAHLAKIAGKYHLFVTGRLLRNGLGRTGVPGGVDDVLAATSDRPDRGYSDFYVAFPDAGQTALFRDGAGAWWATYSGGDARAILRGRPAAFRVEQVPATAPRWPVGFAGLEPPARFAAGLMLRPDPKFIYERGMGDARVVPLDKVPGQKAEVPWVRDTFILAAPDGKYYLTGTSGDMDGICLWSSPDLQRFTFVKQVWAPGKDPARWYNDKPDRLVWAPELHYIKGTYWIAFCLSTGAKGKNGLLRSASGKPEGPYEPAFPENRGVDQHIDSSLFEDTDGAVYYVWQDGLIRKLNAAMNGFDGEEKKILPADGQRVGYEGATVVKIGGWYVLTAAEWNGGANRTDGTYDMMYSCARSLAGPWKPRRVAVPHAGHGVLFKDKDGKWMASFFGNDRTAPCRAMPGIVPVDVRDTAEDLVLAPSPGHGEGVKP